jgi:prevent-host-death family protein
VVCIGGDGVRSRRRRRSVRGGTDLVIMVTVIKTSLAEAKAHLSELVDQAEHKKKRIVILRHGKPAAAIVPVEVAAPKKPRAKVMTDEEVLAFFDDAARCGDPTFPAVEDLVRGRR